MSEPTGYEDSPDTTDGEVGPGGEQVEGQQHPLLAYYLSSVKQSQFFRDGQGLGSAMSEEEVRRMRTAYYGMISEVDEHLGRVIGYLKRVSSFSEMRQEEAEHRFYAEDCQ